MDKVQQIRDAYLSHFRVGGQIIFSEMHFLESLSINCEKYWCKVEGGFIWISDSIAWEIGKGLENQEESLINELYNRICQ